MILESLMLKDFGVYGGKHFIDLKTTYPEKPIILFGGMNGAGKTTLLDAIQLVLYGKNAKCAGRGSLPYRKYLNEMIHHGANKNDGARIELTFSRSMDGQLNRYKVIRAWHENSKGIDEKLDLSCNDRQDSVLTDVWSEFIENYIPNGLAHLFFFDAEQIKDLADGVNTSEILGAAVNCLLGLDLVEKLEIDLCTLEKRKQTVVKNHSTHISLDDLELEMGIIQGQHDGIIGKRGELNQKANRIKSKLAELKELYRQEGGSLYDERELIEQQNKENAISIFEKEKELKELAGGILPLSIIQSQLKEAEKQIEKELKSNEENNTIDILIKRDKALIKKLKTLKIPVKYLDIIKEEIITNRSVYEGSTEVISYINASRETLYRINKYREKRLPEEIDSTNRILNQLEILRESKERINDKLTKIPERDSIAEIQRSIAGQENILNEINDAILENRAQEDILLKKHDIYTKRYRKNMEALLETKQADDHNIRILNNIKKVNQTLKTFKSDVLKQQSSKLEHLILDSFKSLLRKDDLITAIEIESSSFKIKLKGGDGNALPIERLSAGERQLLATSILWGLAKASGRPLPTIIDTPLGRLDSEHRKNLLERYFPIASHQVILLSTDKEIDVENYNRIKKYIHKSYEIHFDDKTKRTQIKDGYFS